MKVRQGSSLDTLLPDAFRLLAGIVPVAVGLRPSFPSWLSRTVTQLLEGTCIPWLVAPFLPLQSQEGWVESFSWFGSF